MRHIGLDIHRDFCEVAISEAGEIRSPGRIETKPEVLELFARSLGREDEVALEVTGNAWEIARIIEPHVARVVVVARATPGSAQARAKTDRLDARTLAKLLAAARSMRFGCRTSATRALRRRLSRRSQLVRARTRAKNEIHAVLIRRLIAKPRSATSSALPAGAGSRGSSCRSRSARRSTAACARSSSRQEIAELERVIALERSTAGGQRLMSVPGVNVITAATFLAAIGDIGRFPSRASWSAISGSIRGCASLARARRHMGGSRGRARRRRATRSSRRAGARSAQPGPLRAFYERIRARRGHQVAIVASARKLACLFWCLLTREEDYAFAQPSLTRKKLRRLELTAGASAAR